MIVFCPLNDKSDNKILINVKGKGIVDIPLSKNILKKQIQIFDNDGKEIYFKKNITSIRLNFTQKIYGKDLYLTYE